jgi:hypothetical protein
MEAKKMKTPQALTHIEKFETLRFSCSMLAFLPPSSKVRSRQSIVAHTVPVLSSRIVQCRDNTCFTVRVVYRE